MKLSLCLLILGLVSIATCSQVVNFTNQNFNQTITKTKYVMVKFYAPWCGHCKSMVPEYIKLAQLVKDNDIVIGQVDATQQTQIAVRYKIQGYPTMKFFIDGVDVDYRGPRTADQMYGWIKKVSQTVLQEITQQKIDELKQKQHLIVYFGSNPQKKKTVELLNIVDSTLDYFVSPSDQQKLILYPLGKEPVELSSNLEFTLEQIKQWAMLYTIPTVIPLTSKEYLDWVFYDEATMKDVVMLLKEDDVTGEAFQNFETLCQNNKEKFKCCFVEKSMQVYGGVKNYLRSSGKSVLALTRDGLKEAYLYPNAINELTQQSWTQFTNQVSEDKHKNIAASQVDKIDYQNVKVLTDSNFTSFIKEHDVVFAEFYTTTCAHCVEFSKDYDAIAKKVYADSSLGYEIVALDIKKNKQVAAELKITSFPTFKVYISGQPVTYDGPRTEQAILNFIKSAKDSKPIPAGSIAQVPSPAVVIYDPAEVTSLKLLPALFTRYPIYHLKEGSLIKVILKQQTDTNYIGEMNLDDVAKWLYRKTDPVLVDLLNPNIDNKLREALEAKTHLLGLIDTEPSLSVSLRSTLEDYCKASTLVCGFAKKGQSNFAQFIQWLGVDAQGTSSFVYINTQTYDKYVFPNRIEELSIETIGQFINDVKEGKVKKSVQLPEDKLKKEQKQEQKKAQTTTQEESKESEDTDDSEQKPQESEL